MSTTLYSVESFHKLVREMIQESIREQMLSELKRLRLKELGGVIGTQSTDFSDPTTGTSETTETSGTKSGIKTDAGNKDVATNVLVPGTNLNVNAALQTAAKDPNFKSKADLIQKVSDQIAGMKGVVVKENEQEGTGDVPEEPSKQRVNTREPMFTDLIRRISNLVYYGDASDEEIVGELSDAIDEVNVTSRWVKFIAEMTRQGKNLTDDPMSEVRRPRKKISSL